MRDLSTTPTTFFLDRSLGRYSIANALRAAGASVEIHDDHFAPAATDAEWLGAVGTRGWLVLTKDKRIQQRVIELTAVAKARVRMFQLTAGNLQASEMAAAFVGALSKMEAFARGNPAPFIASVTRGGRVGMLLNRARLKRFL